MYNNLEQQQSSFSKIRRNLYLIVTISLLNHTMSTTYSIMSFKEQSAGFISIIVSAVVCFFLSKSHLTIYGISILGILFLSMIKGYYTRAEIYCVVAMSGFIIFPLWRMIHSMGGIFSSLPGRIHASMVFGVSLIALVKFFPLSIENINVFFIAANQNALTSPIQIIQQTFQQFNWITLVITIVCILLLFGLRERLNSIPFIGIFIILGIIINWKHYFKSFEDLCNVQDVDCTFYIVKTANLIQPSLQQLIKLLPAACVMTVIVVFQQFLYLEEFERRGKRFGSQGNLGDIKSQTRILGLANIVAGCLGGLPICINLFGTYENFAFNMRRPNTKGTKLVGLMQIPVSYALYSVLKWFFNRVPLFILFIVIATPGIYFLRNMLKIHYRNIIYITVLAALNVVTHPMIALVVAAFLATHQIAQLLKGIPAEILLQNMENFEGERKSSTLAQVVEKNQEKFVTEFESRVIEIQDDKPTSLQQNAYVLYRFTGSISYLNYFGHIQQIKNILEKYIKPNEIPLLLSFRYSQVIDEQSLEELAQFIQSLRSNQIQVIFTGLHHEMMLKMEKIQYFQDMLKEDNRCMYCLYQG